MTFPVYLHIFGWRVHPHPVMEAAGFFVGLAGVILARRRERPPLARRPASHHLWLLAGAAIGALLGARLLAWIEGPAPPTMDNLLAGGKTIVGGLAGAWVGTEIVKKCLGITRRTGDAWVLGLCAAIAVGRIGCFLTGLSDNTYGLPTKLPWGVNFGDGIPRHPTQLYESLFALTLFVVFWALRARPFREGDRFRLFILAYMLFRFFVEFLKPTRKPYLGLSAIQLTTLLTAAAALYSLRAEWSVASDQLSDEHNASSRREAMVTRNAKHEAKN